MSQITSNQLFGECLIPYAMKAKNAPNSINTGGTVCAHFILHCYGKWRVENARWF